MRFYLLVLILLLLGAVTYLNATSLFSEGFDNAWPPTLNGNAWNTDSSQRVGVSVTTPHSEPYCVYFNINTDKLTTPLIAEPGLLSFWHKQQYSAYPTDFWVQISHSTSGPWTEVAHFWAGSTWTNVTVDLSSYSNIYVRWSLYSGTARCDKYMFLDGVLNDERTPVELSSFTAAVVQLQNQNAVNLHWTTESETMVAGYNVLRNSTNNAGSAVQVNLNMIGATNTSGPANYDFTDVEIENGTSFYWLQSNDLGGNVEMFGPISVWLASDDNPGGVPPLLPGVRTSLLNVYPNPFKPANLATNIPFVLTEKTNVRLEIFNQKGQLVWSYERSNADAGMYNVNWNGKDGHGKALSSGVYYCRMSNANYLGVKKVVLIK